MKKDDPRNSQHPGPKTLQNEDSESKGKQCSERLKSDEITSVPNDTTRVSSSGNQGPGTSIMANTRSDSEITSTEIRSDHPGNHSSSTIPNPNTMCNQKEESKSNSASKNNDGTSRASSNDKSVGRGWFDWIPSLFFGKPNVNHLQSVTSHKTPTKTDPPSQRLKRKHLQPTSARIRNDIVAKDNALKRNGIATSSTKLFSTRNCENNSANVRKFSIPGSVCQEEVLNLISRSKPATTKEELATQNSIQHRPLGNTNKVNEKAETLETTSKEKEHEAKSEKGKATPHFYGIWRLKERSSEAETKENATDISKYESMDWEEPNIVSQDNVRRYAEVNSVRTKESYEPMDVEVNVRNTLKEGKENNGVESMEVCAEIEGNPNSTEPMDVAIESESGASGTNTISIGVSKSMICNGATTSDILCVPEVVRTSASTCEVATEPCPSAITSKDYKGTSSESNKDQTQGAGSSLEAIQEGEHESGVTSDTIRISEPKLSYGNMKDSDSGSVNYNTKDGRELNWARKLEGNKDYTTKSKNTRIINKKKSISKVGVKEENGNGIPLEEKIRNGRVSLFAKLQPALTTSEDTSNIFTESRFPLHLSLLENSLSAQIRSRLGKRHSSDLQTRFVFGPFRQVPLLERPFKIKKLTDSSDCIDNRNQEE